MTLTANLTDLLDRFKRGRYRAPPVRRVHLPKEGTNKTPPIGIPTLEEKVLQRAVLMVLESVYEQDFLDCSYGFRPGRSAHQALDAPWQGLRAQRGNWVIELDIHAYFHSVGRAHLRDCLDQWVRDGVIRRVLGKWMNAGVREYGVIDHPEDGVPQGGCISPLLSNLYLHEVLDLWFEQEVKPRMRGRVFMVRFADEAVLGFEREEVARGVLEVLPKRLGRFGLTLHSENTRLVDFCRPDRRPEGTQRERSFDMLSFTRSSLYAWFTVCTPRNRLLDQRHQYELGGSGCGLRLYCGISLEDPSPALQTSHRDPVPRTVPFLGRPLRSQPSTSRAATLCGCDVATP